MALAQISCDCFQSVCGILTKFEIDNATNYLNEFENDFKASKQLVHSFIAALRKWLWDILSCDIFCLLFTPFAFMHKFKLTEQSNRFSHQLLPNPSLRLFLYSIHFQVVCTISFVFRLIVDISVSGSYTFYQLSFYFDLKCHRQQSFASEWNIWTERKGIKWKTSIDSTYFVIKLKHSMFFLLPVPPGSSHTNRTFSKHFASSHRTHYLIVLI